MAQWTTDRERRGITVARQPTSELSGGLLLFFFFLNHTIVNISSFCHDGFFELEDTSEIINFNFFVL